MTESEQLFRRFCESQGWHLERIDEQSAAQGSRVPDFRLRLEHGADQGSPIVPVRERAGPGKKLTREMNTSISCIAVLREFFNGDMIPYGMAGPNPEYAMAVYHSPFAKHPLDPELLASSRVRHYRMSEDEKSWEPYPS
ncbi:MAG: hypothetical protein OXG58_01740 [Gemmatimonadetes bacterium]|nr:hypothetical protein [Gemmatimonadota bacterium]MCY3942568.1 hypothetical protein [Gemmatimonadota bacterium]